MSATEIAVSTAKLAAQAAADKLGTDIVAFDVSEQLAITDIFLVVSASNERQVGAVVDGIEEVSEVHSISGQYDLIGKFYLAPEQDIGLFVVERLQTVPGVKDTYTLQTFNAFSGGRA